MDKSIENKTFLPLSIEGESVSFSHVDNTCEYKIQIIKKKKGVWCLKGRSDAKKKSAHPCKWERGVKGEGGEMID